MSNLQGSHEIMDLYSGKRITRRKVHEIPISPAIVKLVDNMGAAQGITSLKIRSCKGEIEFPDDWIAGVDYEQDSDSEEEDYEEEHSQQEDI